VDADNPAGPDGIWLTEDDGLALQMDFPCINAGTTDNAPENDILGRLRDAMPDIGAYEFPGVEPTPTPAPPSAPTIALALTIIITDPSAVDPGQTVFYTYRWTSDGSDEVTHGPTEALQDTLTETDLVQPGETWTVTVTPSAGGIEGESVEAKVKILNPESGVAVWIVYR